ncbi:hypothetical protein B9H04_17040 [Halorubrum ezzemoulense DSM 17463]|uniref:Uncharacterized protein n=1 Tax=Halorubrum ezzemoulense DSM 17463 TaxID=1121945 RepID=A0A1X4G691_HALEZ|nr:hypothetical protein [Halorubrum ezzemoulense]OSO90292.1 hypothetical protein B9H04_17040 [Halorubrum ezzemoulense DSM 17463]OYR78342.1 hypothetical protein DJ77_01215 [Halorubrum ezzemoulense]
MLGFLDGCEDMIGHRQSTDKVIADAGFCIDPTTDAIAEQTLSTYQRAIDGRGDERARAESSRYALVEALSASRSMSG